MLKFKIKEVLLAVGKRYPQQWLVKVCGFTKSKAYKIINGKQNSINLADLTEICYYLQCSPNDLLYWQPDKYRPLAPTHPCHTQLTPPDAIPEWNNLFKKMMPEEVLALKKIAEETLDKRIKK